MSNNNQNQVQDAGTQAAQINETLNVGDVVNNYGHEFIVAEVSPTTKMTDEATPRRVFYYKGICTASPGNSTIRGTGYNGGSYSWRADEGKRRGTAAEVAAMMETLNRMGLPAPVIIDGGNNEVAEIGDGIWVPVREEVSAK